LGFVYSKILYLQWTGYDARLHRYSPGKFLLVKVIEESAREGLSEIDYGYGEEWYKDHFGTSQWQDAVLYLFAPTFKGAALNAARTGIILINRTLHWCLQQTGLFAAIKRRWRDRLRNRARMLESVA
jgi:CelD/BcsL family acetyltransferase involved in cellulose biosynthesis